MFLKLSCDQLRPAPVAANGSVIENFQSITCKPDYIRHSFEELRLEFLRTGRQLTSADIVRQNATVRIAAQ
ncbi:hypothetical protein DAEQUDRAFT_763066 [Daedalea quercina L-15889]|uniref:Uncharacterized protein n=1 Tax=Daedalea quercina L-15889 TaxID=1314783 RepID=A0A165SQG9_9APHY|nr:hypothetical protein DAEQUDRAFT_763066 [Daedalea quercina L-15889]